MQTAASAPAEKPKISYSISIRYGRNPVNIDAEFPTPLPSPVFVGGASAVGKTAIIQAVLGGNAMFTRPRSVTSRARREGESLDEYSFVSRETIESMYASGSVSTIDEVYGNLYAMETESVHAALRSGKFPIKEIHPKNFDKLRQFFPNMISVLVLRLGADRCQNQNTPRWAVERKQADDSFFSTISPYSVDITLYASADETPADLAYLLETKIFLYSAGLRLFPRTSVIHQVNCAGYDAAAPEFTEAQRITTKNFHDLSVGFFRRTIAAHAHEGCRCLELGPGHGWLRSAVSLSRTEYQVLDIAPAMLARHENCVRIAGDVSAIPLRRASCDLVLASLGDPFCHPLGLTEVWRVLKPNGVFILTIPSHVWSSSLRAVDRRLTTRFRLSTGREVEVYSFTYTTAQLRALGMACGFVCEEASVTYGRSLPTNIPISPAIVAAAEAAGVPLADMALVDSYVFRKASLGRSDEGQAIREAL